MSHPLRRSLPVLGLLLLAGPAAATPNFPPTLQEELGLAAAPPCSLCHQGTPQVGTVVTPFGEAMRERGLVFYDAAALREALAALAAEAVDSDGDGTPDVDELRAGGDPNRAPVSGGGELPLEFGEPTYGCASSGAGTPAALLLLLLAGVLGRVRTRVDTSAAGRCALQRTAAPRPPHAP